MAVEERRKRVEMLEKCAIPEKFGACFLEIIEANDFGQMNFYFLPIVRQLADTNRYLAKINGACLSRIKILRQEGTC